VLPAFMSDCSSAVSSADRIESSSKAAENRDVLYIGDLDLSGNMIEANTRAVLQDEGWVGEWEHIAMTKRQAQRYRIEPILKTDGRYTDRRPHLAIEVESLGQVRVQNLLRSILDARLPEPLDDVLERQQEQEDAAARRLRRWKVA
jgi:hypothetical protein